MNVVRQSGAKHRSLWYGMELWAALFLSLLLLSSAIIFAVSPMNGEDYALTKLFTDASLLDRVTWAIEKSIDQSTHWNARLGEQFSIFWLSMPGALFAIANLIAISSFVFLIALFATPQDKWRRNTLIVTSFLAITACFLLWPRLEVFFWRTTAAGYLQPLVLTLLFLLPFYSLPSCRFFLGSWRGSVIFFVLGLLCGLSFENIPPALLPYMVLITYRHLTEKTDFSARLGMATLFYFLGWVLLMIAPSTAARTAYYVSVANIPAASFGYFYNQSFIVLHEFVKVSAPLIVTLIAVLVMNFYFKTGAWRQSAKFYLLFVPAGLCVLSVVKAPYIEPRAFALAWIILIIVIIRLSHEILQKLPDRSALAVIICIGIASIGLAGDIFANYLDYSRKVSARTELIMSKQQSAECREGLAMELIRSHVDIRWLNNRENWVAASLPQVSNYFSCKLYVNSQ